MDKDFDFVTVDCRWKQLVYKRKRTECRNDLLSGVPASPSTARDLITTHWCQSHLGTGLSCPLCTGLMKDAVLASKCCFKSFCDKCIRDRIQSNSLCVCGATNVVADDFLPNRTLRDTIAWFLKSSKCRGANSGSTFQLTDEEMQQKLVSRDLGNKKRKCADMQSRLRQHFAAEDYEFRHNDRQFKKRPPTLALKEWREKRGDFIKH